MIAPITKNVDIDLSLTNTYVIINAEEGDIRTRFVTITLLDNGKIYDLSTLSDAKARLQGTRSDGRAILNNCTIEDNKIKFELTADLTTCVGIHKCQVALYDNEALLTSIPFKIKINPSTLDENAIVAEPMFSVLTDTLLRVEEANRQATQNMEDIRVILEESTEVNNQVRDTLVVAEGIITEGREVIDTVNTQIGNITQIGTDVSEAERIRQSNEEQRVFNESERVKSEAIRIEIENNRQTAEETRTTNEDTRQANEEVRITNENERIANETTRQQNEIVRETNEATRQSNEQERENLRDGLVTATNNANTAINNANNATLEAEEAAQYAQEMGDRCKDIVAGTGLISSSEKGVANGVATLDENGHVPESQLKVDISEVKNYVDNTYVKKEEGKGLSTNDYTNIEKNKLGNLDDTLLNKLGESEYGNLTFNGEDINAAQMTGATSELDGTSGTVIAPKAGDQDKFLRGDGTWAKIDSGAKISPKNTVNPSIKNGNSKCTITWGDPDDIIVDGVVFSTWKGTKLVMKENSYPEDENDGIILVDNTVKNTYVSTGYEVTGLANGNAYYFKLFPYSTDGIYNYQDSNNLLGNPSLVKLDPCTNISLSSTMGSITVSWVDPEATKTVDDNTATWAKTVLVYKEGAAYPSSLSDGIIAVTETTRNQYSSYGYEITGLENGKQYSFSLFAVSTENSLSDATNATAKLWATVTVVTDETTLYGKSVTASYNSIIITGTFNNSGSVTLQIPWIGTTTITSTDGTDTATSSINVSAYENTYSVELSFLKIVTFANGTDEEIVAMIEAHYNDKINLSDYWAVGDTRNVNLSAMSATGVGESHRAQTVQLVIGDFEHDELTTSINGHAKAAITLLQKDCLMDATSVSNSNNGSADTERGYMNSTNTNVGGWKSCARRTWCNNVYFSALPSALQSIVKTVNKKVSVGNNSSTIETVQDKIFLAAEIEIFGSTTYSYAGEGTQYQFYKNVTANRYKMPKWNSSYVSNRYWQRSPYSGDTTCFCCVDSNGNASSTSASSAYGVAPCLCI